MNQTQFFRMIDALHTERTTVMKAKQAKYTPGSSPNDVNPFANFERRAPSNAKTPIEVCYNDMSKHIDCLGVMCRNEIPLSRELITEVLADAHNYVDLIGGQLFDTLEAERALETVDGRYNFYGVGEEEVAFDKHLPTGTEKVVIHEAKRSE